MLFRSAMRFKQAGMSLEAIRDYRLLAGEGEATVIERKALLLETQKNLEKRIEEMQESLELIRYKLAHYDEGCGDVTQEIIKAWQKSLDLK